MTVIPPAPAAPTHYGESVVLYSESERVEAVVDGAPANAFGQTNGRLYIVEPGKPTKVPYEAARFILEHLAYTGVVAVDVTDTDTGTKYDLPKAKRESSEALRKSDDMRFKSWISGVIDDFVKKAKPVPQPDDSIMKIVERRGYDLKQYGIVPIGWAEKGKTDELQAMRDEIAQLRRALAQQAASTNPSTTVPEPTAKGK